MPYIIECSCPNCGKKTKGMEGIEKNFGWRIVKGKKIPQSFCRKCRKH